jgi:REP element-mobilizing transposase RayT
MKSQFQDEQYYHVYNRGAHEGLIFFSDENYRYCIHLFNNYAQKYSVGIIAYCLMPNHYHLLLRQETNGSISRFLQTTFNAYTQAVNKQQKLHGTLFESRAQSLCLDSETYLLRLVCYIHCNPVMAGLVALPEEWEFSDYRVWAGLDKVTASGERALYFETGKEYSTFVQSYLQEKNDAQFEKYLFKE